MQPPTLDTSVADAAADMMPRFFTAQQFAALRKFSDILMPPMRARRARSTRTRRNSWTS